MVLQAKIEAVVEFDNPDVNVSVHCDQDGESEKYGFLLLLTFLILRMLSLARQEKTPMLTMLSYGSQGLSESLPLTLEEYSSHYKQELPNINHTLTNSSPRSFTASLQYGNNRHTTRLRPKGFGVLGKNIDFSGYMVILLVHDFMIKKYLNDKEMLECIDSIIIDCSDVLIEHDGKLGTFEEYDNIENLVSNYKSY